MEKSNEAQDEVEPTVRSRGSQKVISELADEMGKGDCAGEIG